MLRGASVHVRTTAAHPEAAAPEGDARDWWWAAYNVLVAAQFAPVLTMFVMRALARESRGDRAHRYAQVHNAGEEERFGLQRAGAASAASHTYAGRRDAAAMTGGMDRRGPFADVDYPGGDGPDNPFVIHSVRPCDTLEGILLRYRIRLAEMKRWNAFPGRQYNVCAELRIPKRLLPPNFAVRAVCAAQG